ncbi:MAG: hypothetical protein IK066_07690 [Kiritimatiellae bacterium]|nr:hypothetical protein [Kiritimatiellia bacterium]
MKKNFWMAVVAAVAALVAASGCTTAQRKTTPFYKTTAPSAAMAAKAAEGKSEGERAVDRVNVWPLAYWNRPVGSVLWPILTFSEDHFALFPLYSQFRQDGEGGKWDEFNVLWPLAQFDTKGKDYRVFPVYWGKDRKGKGYQAVFPLYWNGDGYNALLPLWFVGDDFVWTPLVGWSDTGWNALLVVGGEKFVRKDSLRKESWVFPAYSLAREWNVAGDGTKSPRWTEFWMLAGLWDWEWEGGTNVFWRVFPLAGRERDADFAERWGWLDGERLPEGLRPIEPGRRAELRAQAEELRAEKKSVWAETGQKRLRMGTNWVEVAELPGYEWSRKDDRWWLLELAGREAWVNGHWVDGEGARVCWDSDAEAERYVVEGEREWGNILVAKGRTERKATFDAASGAKTGDETRSNGHVLGLLYRWSGQKGVEGEEDWARRRVLWKLWDWERRGKNVSLDVFPGVTWDSREDGYRKASWLWRLFRWERGADGRLAVDVLFVPVWRSGAERRSEK